jgi:hypothetical protein
MPLVYPIRAVTLQRLDGVGSGNPGKDALEDPGRDRRCECLEHRLRIGFGADGLPDVLGKPIRTLHIRVEVGPDQAGRR